MQGERPIRMDSPELGRFGDSRLAATGVALATAMRQRPTMCLSLLGGSREQTRRFAAFLDNEAVSRHEMLTFAGRLTGERARGRHVLAPVDSSELNYATHDGRKKGFGTVGSGRDLGVLLHPIIAVDAETGGVLGVVGAEVINRGPERVEDHKKRPADEKESRRWLASAELAGEVLAPAAMITVVEDREGDIYDQFARCPPNVHLLVRAAQNRALVEGGKLFERCGAWSEVSRWTITVPPRRGASGSGASGSGASGQDERTAVVAVRFGEATLRRPGTADKALAATVRLRVVDAREVDPPAGVKDPIHWCLLTTHAVGTAAEAIQVVGWYRRRWIIEQVFRTLKTDGVNVETSQITTPASLLKLVTVALIVAVQVVQMALGRDGSTGQPLTDAIASPAELPALHAINASLEGRTDKLRNPFDPSTLAWYVWIVARLGGWAGYTSKGYRPPGPKTLARGLKRLNDMVSGWLIANHSGLTGPP
jgi:hypothetical protein